MPYINDEQRRFIDGPLNVFLGAIGKLDPGSLNYIVTRLLRHQWPTTYSEYNAQIGMLESCKLELYRRAVAPYEDRKAEDNGDVYG